MIGLLASFLFFAHGERQKNLFSKIVDCFPPDFVEMLYLAIIRNFKKRKIILINIFIQSLLVYMAFCICWCSRYSGGKWNKRFNPLTFWQFFSRHYIEWFGTTPFLSVRLSKIGLFSDLSLLCHIKMLCHAHVFSYM